MKLELQREREPSIEARLARHFAAQKNTYAVKKRQSINETKNWLVYCLRKTGLLIKRLTTNCMAHILTSR